MQFSEEQRGTIQSRHPHTLIPAVPGSGKTTLLIEWIATQIEQGVFTPELCTVIMFNVAAKDQFIAKLKKRMPRSKLPQVLTFHSLGNRICKSMMQRNFIPKREIINEGHKVDLLANQCIVNCIGKSQWNAIKETDPFALDTFLQFIEQVKAQLSTPKKVFSSLRLSPKARFFIEAFDLFEKSLADSNSMTLSDLTYLPVKACMEDTSLIAKLSNKREFVAVDEAQDMNLNQFSLFRIVAGDRARTALIGDNDQTIYSWRGSDPEIMANRYKRQFKDVTLRPLSYTYRYGHELAMASSALISYNTKRLDTLCVSAHDKLHTSIHIHPTDDEGTAGAELIEHLLNEKQAKYKDIIILCRLYASSTQIELACLSKGIPVFVTGNNTVFKTKESDFIYSLLMMATGSYYSSNQKQRETLLLSLLKNPSLYLKNDLVANLARQLSALTPFPSKVRDIPKVMGIQQYAEKSIIQRCMAISKVLSTHVEASAYYVINEYLHDVEYYTKLNKNTLTKRQVTEASDRMMALMSFVKNKNLPAQSLLKLFDEMRERQADNQMQPKDAITVTTIHQVKGLDFDHVILPSVNDARYPHEMEGDFIINQDIEEERRLLYVGITRAVKSAHLLCPDDPALKKYLETGTTKRKKNRKRIDRASRFIYEMQIKEVKDLMATPSNEAVHPTLQRYQQRLIVDNEKKQEKL